MSLTGKLNRLFAVLLCTLLLLGCAQAMAASTCAHENVSIDYDCYERKAGEEWKADDNGKTHSALCLQYDFYYCNDCYETWTENTVEKVITNEHLCIGQSGECLYCDYVCKHKNLEITYGAYVLNTGEEWKADANGTTHSGVCQQRDEYWCPDCYVFWTKNDVVKTIEEEHRFSYPSDENIYCYECGYVCPHTETELMYKDCFSLVEGETWRDDGNGLTHTGLCEQYELYLCHQCQKHIRKNLKVGDFSVYHSGDAQCDECKAKLNTDWRIKKHPKDVTAYIGEKVTMKVVVEQKENTGKDYTLSYQWYYRDAGSKDYFKKSSVKTPTYSTTMTAAKAGRELFCEITDQYGNIRFTDSATILAPELTITKEPKNVTASAGETVKFTVKATGESLKYQWYYRNAGDKEWKKAGSKTSSYSTEMTEKRSGRQFYCLITDLYGNKKESKTVTMKLPALKITSEPKDAYAYEGEKAKVSVKATGDGLTYQWYYSTDGGKSWEKASGTKSSYSLTMTDARNGRKMYCVVKDAYGAKKTTKTVTLTTRHKAAITAQPKSAKAFDGKKATTTVTATGDGITYQWYYKDPGMSAYKKSSITTAKCSVTMKAERDGRKMYCIVKDKYGNEAKSETVTLSMKKTVAITSNPKSQTKAVGEKAKFTVKATGDGLKYQWQYKNAGSDTWNDASSTSASYSPTVKASHDGRKFRCIVTDAYGNEAKSKTATLTVQ